MERLPMCRMCLAENVRLCIVANRNLHKLYEKLTGIPFITEDSRPILACVFCFAKLKKCYRLVQQCLKAEKIFAQRMNGISEPNSLTDENRLEVFRGFSKTPVEQINIVDHIAVKEEAVSEGPDDVIVPKKEYQTDEPEPEDLDNSGDDKSIIKCKIEVEDEEVPKKKRRTRETISKC